MKFSQNSVPPPAQMQLAPMVDIVFLLLIFFIVTSTIRDQELELEIKVPVADQASNQAQTVGQLVVNIFADGSVFVEGSAISEEELFERMSAISAVYEEQAVIIRSDATTDAQDIVNVINTCSRAGIWNVTIATNKPPAE